MAAGATGTKRAPAFGVRGGGSEALNDYVPRMTFASSTLPRGAKKKPSTMPPDNDVDDAPQSGSAPQSNLPPFMRKGKAKKYADTVTEPARRAANGQSRVRPTDAKVHAGVGYLADTAQKPLPKPMIKPSRVGLFTAKAKAAGMSVQAYAAHVMANKDKHPTATVKQANFARNFGGRK